MNTNFILSKNLSLLLFCFIILFSIQSCKKIEKEISASLKNKELTADQFFTIPANANPELAKVAADLYKQHGFKEQLNTFIQKNGFPVWDKSFVELKQNTLNNITNASAAIETENSDSSGVIFIPFKDVSTNEIKSYAICFKHDSVYSYKLYNKYDVTNISAGANDTLKQAKKITLSYIAYFEKTINGQENTFFGGNTNQSIGNVSISVVQSQVTNTRTTENSTTCGYWSYLESVYVVTDESGTTVIEIVRAPYYVFCGITIGATGSGSSWNPSNVGTPRHLPGGNNSGSGITFYSGSASGNGTPTYGWWNYGTGYNGIYVTESWQNDPTSFYPGWSGPSAYWYADPNEVLVQQLASALNLNYDQRLLLLNNTGLITSVKDLVDKNFSDINLSDKEILVKGFLDKLNTDP